jgi:hypothetical protein
MARFILPMLANENASERKCMQIQQTSPLHFLAVKHDVICKMINVAVEELC